MVRPLRVRALALSAALFAAAPLALVGASPAHAFTADSYAVGDLGACGDILTPTNGGWTGQRTFLSLRTQSVSPWHLMRPYQVRLDELCTLNSTTIGVRYLATAPTSWPHSGTASTVYGQWDTPVRWSCYNSSGVVQSFTSTGFASFAPVVEPTFSAQTRAEFTVPSGCARLREFTFQVVPYNGAEGQPSSPVQVNNVTWSAARAISGTPYTNTPPSSLEALCADETVTWSQCEAIRVKNSAAWGDTCGDPANAAVYGTTYPGTLTLLDGEFDFGSWITWHGACLFYPLGGFDKDAAVKTAWESSPNADVGDQIVGMADAFTYAPGCGVLATTPTDSPLPGFTLDTCTWTWASPVKIVLGIGVLILGFWAFIAYVVRAVSGVIRKDVPSPVDAS